MNRQVVLVLVVSVIICSIGYVKGQVKLDELFKPCKKNTTTFDSCVMDVINDLQPYYKSGLRNYGIGSLDPFFAPEVIQKRNGALFNYKLVLRNVTETGWSISRMTNFRSNLPKYYIQYTQFFPDKKLQGWYEIEGTFFGQNVKNKGAWNLRLQNYSQTTTGTRRPVRDSLGNPVKNPPVKVKIMIQNCDNMELHIGHLAGGRTIMENMLDWIINTAWQPGYVVLAPLINDLISTAFTEIMNKNFQNFPFEQIFTN